MNGINIDMENASVTDELEASNGSLIIADNVNIRMKNNKIKDVIIQGEDSVSCLESNWVYVRMRDEAMGGRDVMLSGYYNPSKEVTVQTEEGVDSTYTISYKFLYEGTSGTNYSRTVNSYIRYNAYFIQLNIMCFGSQMMIYQVIMQEM